MAFLCACSSGNLNVVKEYLLSKTDPNSGDRFHSALTIAIESSRVDVVKELVRCGANVNYTQPLSRKSPLIIASTIGNIDIVKHLVEHGARVNHTSASNENAIMFASKNGHDDVVKFLISKCKLHNSMLLAINNLHYTTTCILLPNTPKYYYNAAAFSSIISRNLDFLKLFIPAIHPDDKHIDPFLMTCVNINWMEGIDYLLQHGASVNIKNNLGYTPLIYAVRKQHVHIVQYLIDRGADVNHINLHDMCPLSIACTCDMYNIAELLIHHGANVNIFKKETILMKTAANGKHLIVPLLLKHGADPFVNVNGLTALTCAKVGKHTMIVDMLTDVNRISILQPNTTDIIQSMFTTILEFSIWEKYLIQETKDTLQKMIMDDQTDRMACFTALIQKEDHQLQLYKENKPHHFSQSTLRGIIRTMRHIYKLIVSYTIHPRDVCILFHRYRYINYISRLS
jgi:ankyrin repeat protein